jgi:uncharacterized protein (TIGR00159 family)
MVENIISTIKEIGISEIIDISLMTALLYAILVWLRKRRANFVLIGILLTCLLYLIAYYFNLSLTTSVLQAFFAVILIALIVIFQEEIRSFFEQIALFSRMGKKRGILQSPPEIEMLVHTLNELARQKQGAILVLKGKDLIGRHLEGGTEIYGQVSESLLLSLFDPHSPGHDGAVVLDQHRLTQFGCHLPLSKHLEKIPHKGTRHAAALGLSELCDALCLVVSEETGGISVIQKGDIFEIKTNEELRKILQSFYLQLTSALQKLGWKEFFKKDFLGKNYREKILAVVLSVTLWVVLVHEAKYTIKSYQVPVGYFQLDTNLTVKQIKPPEVKVTFSGPGNTFHFLSEKNIHLTIRLTKNEPGTETISLSRADFNYPREINLENIEPRRVEVFLENK